MKVPCSISIWTLTWSRISETPPPPATPPPLQAELTQVRRTSYRVAHKDLPPGWDAAKTNDGRLYFYCKATGQRTWKHPRELANANGGSKKRRRSSVSGWRQSVDKKGREYYYNKVRAAAQRPRGWWRGRGGVWLASPCGTGAVAACRSAKRPRLARQLVLLRLRRRSLARAAASLVLVLPPPAVHQAEIVEETSRLGRHGGPCTCRRRRRR